MNFILCGLNGRECIIKITALMKEPVRFLFRKKLKNNNFRWYTIDENGEEQKAISLNNNPGFITGDKVIRWGYSGEIDKESGVLIYQCARAIDTISNKARSRLVLAEAGVPVPETRLNAPMDSYPFIVRPIRHSRGRNFWIVNNEREYEQLLDPVNGPALIYYHFNQLYYSKYYPKKEEVRVYVAHGKVLMIKDKNYNPESDSIQANHDISGDDWRVVPVNEYKRYKTACKIACDAVKAVGAHTGGVDVMINRDHDTMKFCVCEINSAPTIKLSEYGTKRYAMYFDWLFREQRDYWSYVHPETGEHREHPSLGKSYWFTNEQLEE